MIFCKWSFTSWLHVWNYYFNEQCFDSLYPSNFLSKMWEVILIYNLPPTAFDKCMKVFLPKLMIFYQWTFTSLLPSMFLSEVIGLFSSRVTEVRNTPTKQATGLDAWASRVKCPARFVSHLHDICIYIWVVHSFCLFCCLFIIVMTQFVALYEPCKPKPKPKPSTYDTRTTTPWQRSKFRYLDRSQSNKYAINMQIQTISVNK